MSSRSRAFSAVAMMLCVCLAVYSQSRTNASGTGGINTIQGRVFVNGRSPDVPVTIQLESTSYSTLTVTTDQTGAFIFRGLSAGNYSIVVEDKERYETVREYVIIDPEVQLDPNARVPSTSKVFTVPVYLQPKRTSLPKAEVVNARLVNIPKDALKHYDKGLESSRTGKSEIALAEFETAISIYPQFTEAFVQIGKINIQTGKIEPAKTAFQSAVKLDAKNFEAKLGYGICLLENRELKDAEVNLKDSIILNPLSAAAHYYLGMMFIQTKKLDLAQNELESAEKLKLEKDLPLVHKYLGGIYWSKNQFKQAADELEKYLKFSPNANDTDKIRQTIVDLRNK